jgi:hypothetical protein
MKKISIENLLIWAFTEELPKKGAKRPAPMGFSHSSDSLMQFAELGTLIDSDTNSYGLIPAFIYEGEPHADAVAVYDAVLALELRGGFEIERGWNPFPEWQDPQGLIAAEVARAVDHELGRPDRANGMHVVNLVRNAAILRRGPDWEADEPRTVTIKLNGKDDSWFIKRKRKNRMQRFEDYEDNGFDNRARRPLPGAYRKYRLAEPVRAAIAARQDWQLWQSALEALVAALAGRLEDHEIRPFTPNRHPWAGQQAGPSILQVVEKAAR